jgi:hypothetical protein
MTMFRMLKRLCGGLMVLGALDSAAYTREGMIAEYDFSNNTALDTSGNGNHGLIHNAQAAEDRDGNASSAMLFNGQDAWIEIPNNTLYNSLSNITISMWICPQRGPNGENRAGSLIGKQPSGFNASFHTSFTSNHGGLFDFDLCYQDDALKLFFASQFDAGGTEGHIANMTSLEYDQWQHIAVTVSRTENRVRFYVNGELVEDVIYSVYINIGHILSQVTNEPLRIGKRKDADFNPSLYFTGLIDDIKIYNRSLLADEVEELADIDSYIVTLSSNDGSGLSTNVLATYNEPMPEAPTPLRTGWDFTGYFDSPAGGVQYYTPTMASACNWLNASNMTLYAHWEKIPLLCKPGAGDETLFTTQGFYEGFLSDEGDFDGTPTLEVRGTVTLSVFGRADKLNVSAKALMQDRSLVFKNLAWSAEKTKDVSRVKLFAPGGEILDLAVGQTRFWGTLSGGSLGDKMQAVDGMRNRFADLQDAEAKALLNTFRGYYTVALPAYGALSLGEAEAAPEGSGYLTITVGNQGHVNIGGVLADGTKFSKASNLILFDGCGPEACVPLFVPLYSQKGWVSGLLWFDPVKRTIVTDRDLSWFLRWEKPGSGMDGFSELLEACGGFYSTLDALSAHYRFSAGANAVSYFHNGVPASVQPVFPSDISVAADNRRLVITQGVAPRLVDGAYDYAASENPSMATLSFREATGVFSGNFKLYYDYTAQERLYHRAVTVQYSGVLVTRRSEVFEDLPAGLGFYLVPDNNPALAPQSLKRSYPIELDSKR